MELKGAKVNHRSFGSGVIVEREDKYVLVLFDGEEKPRKLACPMVFAALMAAEDPEIQSAMEAEYREMVTREQQAAEERLAYYAENYRVETKEEKEAKKAAIAQQQKEAEKARKAEEKARKEAEKAAEGGEKPAKKPAKKKSTSKKKKEEEKTDEA